MTAIGSAPIFAGPDDCFCGEGANPEAMVLLYNIGYVDVKVGIGCFIEDAVYDF